MKTLPTLLAVAFVFSISSSFAGDCNSGGCCGTKDGSKDKTKDSAMISVRL
jgi:hypothetical protein